MAMPKLLEDLLQNTIPLTEDYFTRLFQSMLAGELNSSQIAAVLTLLKTKKLSGEMLSGAVKALREASVGSPIKSSRRHQYL